MSESAAPLRLDPAPAAPTEPAPTSIRLYPPRLRANLVARSRLTSTLGDDPDRPMTLICAPAGYGKSTLAAQWVTQLALPTAWVALEPEDNDPVAFFGLVVAALRLIDRDLAVPTASLLARNGAPSAEAIVHQLVQDLSVTTRSFVLVLDDYHVIEAPEIHRAVDLLLQHLPPMTRLLLVSRTMPPLRLARLQASGDLLTVTQADLRFTPEETLQFFHDHLGLDLTPSEVALLLETTEGWVIGLQLIGSALRGRDRDETEKFVKELAGSADLGERYLWEEVLDRQPEDVRSFLVETSILDRFNADLCDALTQTRGSADMIRRCERENLFLVPLDGHGGWYRYHHLFADTLRDHLSRTTSEGDVVSLHRRAEAWLETNAYIEDAIRHATAGHDWDQAIRLLEVVCGELFEHDHIASLRAWLNTVPPGMLAKSPRLAFWLAWADGRAGHWSRGGELLRIAEESWTADGDQLGEGLILLWHAVRALHGFHNARAIEYARRSLDHLPPERQVERIIAMMTQGIGHLHHGEPGLAAAIYSDVRIAIDRSGRSWLRPFEMTYSAGVLMQQGKLLEASLLCRQVIKALGDEPSEIWIQPALYQLGSIYLEWGLLDDARRALQRAEDLAEETQTLNWHSQIRTAIARVSWAQGKQEEAFDEAEFAVAIANQFGALQIVRNANAQQARFWLKSKRLALVRRWADSCDLDPYLPPEYERQIEHLTYARLMILQDRPDLALAILKRIDESANEQGRHGDRVEIVLLMALAHKALDDTMEAFRALHDALELGSAGGYLRTFVNEGEPLATLLRHASARVSHRDYVKTILAEIAGSTLHTALGPMEMPDALSEREIEVLRLVAAGLANRDIGQRLFISEKTVKTHLSNIMGKLGSSNRTQAVDQARQLGVL